MRDAEFYREALGHIFNMAVEDEGGDTVAAIEDRARLALKDTTPDEQRRGVLDRRLDVMASNRPA